MIDRHVIACKQDRGRCVFLDECRTADFVAGVKAHAVKCRRLDAALLTIEVSLAHSGRGPSGATVALRDAPDRRVLHHTCYCRAEADHLRGLFRRAGAVTEFVGVVEQALDGLAVLRLEHIERHIDRHRMLLADVSHIYRAADRNVMRRLAGFGNGGAAFRFKLGKNRIHVVELCRIEPHQARADKIVAQIRKQHSKRGKDTGCLGNYDFANTKFPCDRRCV